VQAWLKRLERQLRGSGRISQLAYSLAELRGGTRDDWSRQLRDILTGTQHPGAELITDIDQILAKPSAKDGSNQQQDHLF